MNLIPISNLPISRIIMFSYFIFQCDHLYAAKNLYVVDVYGTNKITSSQIQSRFHSELTTIAAEMNKKVDSKIHLESDPATKAFVKIHKSLVSTKEFSYVNISPIMYAATPIKYITIDVVENKDKHRLSHFLPKPHKNITEPNHLITRLIEYQTLSTDLIYNKKEDLGITNCPAHHCIYGFEHPLLKKYLPIFNQAEKHKKALVNILRFDKDENKRASAVYLLAHIKNRNELVKYLLPSIHDSSASVRNNVLRTLIHVADKDSAGIPLKELITAFNFPNTTDRNKALYVISALADNPKNAQLIKENIGLQLIDNLKLQQPINHDPAYEVLKKISHKTYPDRDYKSWQAWLSQK